MTPAQTLSSVRAQIDESAARYWSDAEIYSHMWRAEVELASEVRCTQARNTATSTVAGTQEYTKPTDCLFIEVLRWDGVKLKKIDQTELEALQNSGYGGSITQGDPAYYYEFADVIGLYPQPGRVATISYWYIKSPAEVTAVSTAFTVPAIFAPYILDYVLYFVFLKDQDKRAEVHLDAWRRGKMQARQTWNMMRFNDQYVRVKDVDAMCSTDLGLI